MAKHHRRFLQGLIRKDKLEQAMISRHGKKLHLVWQSILEKYLIQKILTLVNKY